MWADGPLLLWAARDRLSFGSSASRLLGSGVVWACHLADYPARKDVSVMLILSQLPCEHRQEEKQTLNTSRIARIGYCLFGACTIGTGLPILLLFLR
jgi:hypothetical protein